MLRELQALWYQVCVRFIPPKGLGAARSQCVLKSIFQ
jgi:hypothetical protein